MALILVLKNHSQYFIPLNYVMSLFLYLYKGEKNFPFTLLCSIYCPWHRGFIEKSEHTKEVINCGDVTRQQDKEIWDPKRGKLWEGEHQGKLMEDEGCISRVWYGRGARDTFVKGNSLFLQMATYVLLLDRKREGRELFYSSIAFSLK